MDIVQIVVQTGSVGVAIYVLYILKGIVGKHISHNTQALSELTKVMAELKQIIKDFHRKNGI